LSYRKLLN